MKDRLLSFSDFERMYESYGFLVEDEAAVKASPSIPDATKGDLGVDTKTNKPADTEDPFLALLASFGQIEKQEEKKEGGEAKKISEAAGDPPGGENEGRPEIGDQKTEEPAKNEAPKNDPDKPAVKAEAPVKIVKTPLAKAFDLKVVRRGEKSKRVEEIQKVLGITVDGKFGPATETAVKKFQKENGLLVDGKVGVQTYGTMLKIKKGITDSEEIQKLIEALAKLTPFILMHPDFYGIAQNVTIVTINNIQYVIVIPNQKNAEKAVEKLKEENVLTGGYEFLEKIAEAAKQVAKAVVYTTIGVFILPIAVAMSIVSGALSILEFAVKGVVSVVSSVVQGLAQLGNLAVRVAKGVWKAAKTTAQAIGSLVTGAVEILGKAVAGVAKGLIALAGALGSALAKVGMGLANAAWSILKGVGTACKDIWDGITGGAEVLYNAAKAGIKSLGKAAVEIGQTIVNTVKTTAAAAINFAKSAAETVVDTVKGAGRFIGSTVQAAGDFISDCGKGISSFFSSAVNDCYQETGDPLYESMMLKFAF